MLKSIQRNTYTFKTSPITLTLPFQRCTTFKLNLKLYMTVECNTFFPSYKARKVRTVTFTIFSLYSSALSVQTESYFPVSDRPVRT